MGVRSLVYYIIALFVVLLDQLTKWLIIAKMELGESIAVIDQFFYITSHRNRGAAWGILQNQMLLFYIITVIVIVYLVYFLQKHKHEKKGFNVGLALILGGAIGNFIDRLFRKEVVDFFDFRIFSYHYPIFNIADSALVIGVTILIIYILFEERALKKEKVDEEI